MAKSSYTTLASQLTLEEKVALLSGKDFCTTPGVPRLNIPPLKTVDSVNGVRSEDSHSHNALTTACFPNTSCLAATWNKDLLFALGEELAQQAKLKSAQVVLGPTLNTHRDPRAGRNFECLSEDPLLSGELGAAIVNGIQKHGVGACPKHLVCNDAETWRKKYNVAESLNGRTVREIYLAAFQHLLRNSDPIGLMTAYNKVDGIYCSEHAPLIKDIVRGQWGFKGIIVSDWFGTVSTAGAIDAGLDLEMPFPVFRAGRLLKELKAGTIQESAIDELVVRLLAARDRTRASESVAPETSEISEHTNQLARQLAAEGVVLLKNDNKALPLDLASPALKVAVVGEYATSPVITGGGSASATPQYVHRPLDILKKTHASPDHVTYAPGVRTRVVIPRAPSEILAAKDGRTGVDVAYFNGDDAAPFLEEYVDAPVVHMLANYKPGLNLANSHLRMTTTLTPPSSGDHTLAVRVTGAFTLTVDGKDVLAGPAPDITTEQSLFCPIRMESRVQLPLEAGRAYAIELTVHSRPLMVNEPTPYGATLCFEEFLSEDAAIAEAVAAAQAADVAIVYAGRNAQHESEGFDLVDIALPANQTRLIQAVAAAAPKTVLVLHCGNMIDTTPFLAAVDAVLYAHFPGQEGAQAVVDLLGGAANPSGKLPTTWWAALEQAPSYGHFPPALVAAGADGSTTCDLRYAEGVAVGYRAPELGTRARWPFGFGLSYTSFAFDGFAARVVEGEGGEGGELRCSVRVTNTGSVAGKEVVQVYVSPPENGTTTTTATTGGGWRPARELKGFRKVFLEPGQSAVVEIGIDLLVACSYWSEEDVAWKLEPGTYGASVGPADAEAGSATFVVAKGATWNRL